jgi:hypothetical protein
MLLCDLHTLDVQEAIHVDKLLVLIENYFFFCSVFTYRFKCVMSGPVNLVLKA